MTATTNIRQDKAELRVALNRVLGEGWSDLTEVAVYFRYEQLMANVLHPDDSCGWSADGSDPAMGQLAEVLEQQGKLQEVERKARLLMAQVRFARGTLLAVNRAEGSWGSDLACLDSWAGAVEGNK